MGLFRRKKHSENATQIPDESMEEVDGLTPEAAKKPKKKRPASESLSGPLIPSKVFVDSQPLASFHQTLLSNNNDLRRGNPF
jgi:hypothetical protein